MHVLFDYHAAWNMLSNSTEGYPKKSYKCPRRTTWSQTLAEATLRLLILKHVRNWSYDTLEREVRANLVYRAFTRIGDEKVPDAKTLARLGQAIGPELIGELHERLMELARERGVVQGRKMRVDTTMVETKSVEWERMDSGN